MPSDLSTWLIAVPQDGDSEGLYQEISAKLEQAKALPTSNVVELHIPTLKTGTLDLLISLSEELPKFDAFFTGAVAKIVDTLRNLLNNDPQKLAQHTLVEEKTCDDYLMKGWKWNVGKYGTQRGLRELVDGLNKEMTSIDNVMKSKVNNYNLAKGSLAQMQRKKAGNLSVKSLVDVVPREVMVQDSEYLETLLVAVPSPLTKEWQAKYERLASMVVPRSSLEVATDSEFTLYSVVVFKRQHDQFVQKCRESKFIVREFTFDEESIIKQRQEQQDLSLAEKEMWTDLLRLSRTNFSEAFQVLVHLKILRLFVESVLRYGLPANYIGLVIKPDPRPSKRLITVLTSHFTYLNKQRAGKKSKKASGTDEYTGEYQSLMEQEFYDFVLFEVPSVL
ncbi:ATPase V1 complex subunit C [Dacryopinax primogenitus]|uniref:V-type proton ATPase subunit C n=1 Tax=Dacryopinax primogenitus (strain DJM 731) TaxID=1858805 RepID=M5G2F8_DACPD|nr:ATPase V1 complex subunit C [Dacryopinax primogenitus]EJT97952.1 ATPase V1 complex subunit C [Dacryopinax primogenitus]